MAYNAALNTIYNHYLTTYAPRSSSQYDTHKKSELRNIYNSIIKLNKESPLCILDTSRESQEFAVGLKENARQLRNTIASLGGLSEDAMLNKKVAYSSNDEMASVSFIGESSEDTAVPSFHIEVTALASNQVNMGRFLPSDEEITLPADAYSFDITINDLSYEFQYNIHEGETNRDLQERLARLISNADVGLKADIIDNEKGSSSLRLSSVSTGVKEGKDFIFQISDDKTSKRAGSVDYLGIAYLSRLPSNAEFLLNGESKNALSNHFTIDKMFDVTLNRAAMENEEPAEIGLKTDLDSICENVGRLADGYNSFLKSAAKYQELHPKSGRLVNEMNTLSQLYRAELEKTGINFEADGTLLLDENTFKQSALSDNGKESLSTIKNFTNSILHKTSQISLNPMQYVDKTIVAYKNPAHLFASPYVTSAYSGMMFNSYC